MVRNATKLAADIAAPIEHVEPLPIEASDDAIDAATRAATEAMRNLPMSYDDYREIARDYGRKKAAGDDSLAMFAIDVVTGAKRGTIDPRTTKEKETAKLADTTDQVKELYADYIRARNSGTVHSKETVANKESALRRFALLGALPDIDGVTIMDEIKSLYSSAVASLTKDERKKYRDTFEAYTEAARRQIASPKAELDTVAITASFDKPPPKKTPAAARVIARIAKLAVSLTDGTCKAVDGSILEDLSPEWIDLASKIEAYAADAMIDLEKFESDQKHAALKLEREARRAAQAETV